MQIVNDRVADPGQLGKVIWTVQFTQRNVICDTTQELELADAALVRRELAQKTIGEQAD